MKNLQLFKNNFVRHIAIFLIASYSASAWSQQYDATLEWSQKTELGTLVSGIVAKVHVHAGDTVKKGDVLVQLDDSVFKANVTEYMAKLKSVEEELKEAERERDRALDLYDRTVLSQHDLQMAKNSYLVAKAKYEKINATYTERKYELKYSAIRAPFDAVVLKRNAEPGQVIATEFKQEPLITVAAANKMIARLLVSEEQLSKIIKDKAATIKVDSKSYSGSVQSIGLEPVADKSGAKGYPVNVEFEVKDAILRSGQSAKVIIE